MTKKILLGHSSQDTAYLVQDYPYGFKLRCQIRYWLENKPSKGWRFVSQTEDPRNGRWNAPKASTYSDLAAAMFLDSEEDNHVKWTSLTVNSSVDNIFEFIKLFPEADLKLVKALAKGRAPYMKAAIAKKMLNGDPSPTDLERWNKELQGWEAIAQKLP